MGFPDDKDIALNFIVSLVITHDVGKTCQLMALCDFAFLPEAAIYLAARLLASHRARKGMKIDAGQRCLTACRRELTY